MKIDIGRTPMTMSKKPRKSCLNCAVSRPTAAYVGMDNPILRMREGNRSMFYLDNDSKLICDCGYRVRWPTDEEQEALAKTNKIARWDVAMIPLEPCPMPKSFRQISGAYKKNWEKESEDNHQT